MVTRRTLARLIIKPAIITPDMGNQEAVHQTAGETVQPHLISYVVA
jgi:hypothetical protein